MDFEDRVSWLIDLSSPDEFESAKSAFIKHNMEGKVEKVDEKKGVIKGESRNPVTGKYEKYKVSFDQHIVSYIEPYLIHPVAKILKPIPATNVKATIENWLKDLNVAESYVSEKTFYTDFPGYASSLSKVIATLKKLKKSYSAPYSQRSYKAENARKLEPYLTMIQYAGSHDEAIKKLEEEVEEFSWNPGQKKLFQKHKKKLIGTNVSIALEKIAKIKWPDDFPSAETIRSVYFK